MILSIVLSFLLFLFLAFLLFYSPGFLLIAKSPEKLEDQEVIALSFSLGIVVFVLLAVLLGLLHLRWLTLPTVVAAALISILKHRAKLLGGWRVFVKYKLLLILILLGILTQGLINFPSGYLYPEGLYFWSSQGHDGIWHIALMEEIRKSVPPQNPVFAGERLYNYHYLVDVLMGEFLRIFPFFSSLDLYFRFFPVLFSFLIGISVFSLTKRWRGSTKVGYLALFFVYFTGSFGYIVTFIKQAKILGGETIFWAAQLNTILGNPPHAVAIGILTSFYLSLFFFLKKRDRYWFVVCFLLAAVIAGFKVSAGLVLLVSLGCVSLLDLIQKRQLSLAVLTGLLGVSNFATFKLMTRGGESLLMFLPWWFIRTMVVANERLGWIDLENKRQHYLSKGTWHAMLRVVQLEATAFIIFIVGNLGTRVIGFIEVVKEIFIKGPDLIYKNIFSLTLFLTMLISFLIPLFFVQKGIIYNNIQFMQYFLLIFSFYAAISSDLLLTKIKNNWLKRLSIILLIIFSIPTVLGNLNEFYGPGTTPLAKISNQELQALNYLRSHSNQDDIVLNLPFDRYLRDAYSAQPWPIYVWYSTGYISALSARRTYLASEEQVLITGYPLKERLSQVQAFFSQDGYNKNKQFLNDAHIKYLYLPKKEMTKPLNLKNYPLKPFFENDDVIIYQVI